MAPLPRHPLLASLAFAASVLMLFLGLAELRAKGADKPAENQPESFTARLPCPLFRLGSGAIGTIHGGAKPTG